MLGRIRYWLLHHLPMWFLRRILSDDDYEDLELARCPGFIAAMTHLVEGIEAAFESGKFDISKVPQLRCFEDWWLETHPAETSQ